MASVREMRLRIGSIKNISQVTRALEAVSASKVRKAIAALMGTRPYATKAWQVLTHVARQPGRNSLHPLLTQRASVRTTLVVVIGGDRGLADLHTPAYYWGLPLATRDAKLVRLPGAGGRVQYQPDPFCAAQIQRLRQPGAVYCDWPQGARPADPPSPRRDRRIQQPACGPLVPGCLCNRSSGGG